MAKIKQLRLNFENCEDVTISGDYIGIFGIREIKDELIKELGSVVYKRITHKFFVEILTKENMEISTLGFPGDEDKTAYGRILEMNDIVSIDVILENENSLNEECLHFEVSFLGDDMHDNKAQSTYVSELGYIYIVIDDDFRRGDSSQYFLDEAIDKTFHKDIINSQNWMQKRLKILKISKDL